jgi:hypothetical protein
MKKILFNILFISLLTTSFSQNKINKLMRGTWINGEFKQCLFSCDSNQKSLTLVPRFLYIDSMNFLFYENGFERISKKIRIKYDPAGNYYQIVELGTSSILKLLNDSSIEISSLKGGKKLFEKISNSAMVGAGMQIFFRKYFWRGEELWQLIHIKNNDIRDTQNVLITGTKILTESKKYIAEYEFMDIDQTKVGEQKLFNIMLFDETKNHMSTNERLFAIKKEKHKIILYNKDTIEYILISQRSTNTLIKK